MRDVFRTRPDSDHFALLERLFDDKHLFFSRGKNEVSNHLVQNGIKSEGQCFLRWSTPNNGIKPLMNPAKTSVPHKNHLKKIKKWFQPIQVTFSACSIDSIGISSICDGLVKVRSAVGAANKDEPCPSCKVRNRFTPSVVFF